VHSESLESEESKLSIAERLGALGISLTEPPAPTAAYVQVAQTGNLVFVSGQGPVVGGRPAYVGRLGTEINLAQGQEAARLAAINALAQLQAHLGSLDRVRRIVKIVGFVASAVGFDKQHLVMNGASELLQQVFGEQGRHARTSVGAQALPLGIPVEIELIAEVA
jgi:enamine deaminase RidA (YjgF/YER057c/UK114 family)